MLETSDAMALTAAKVQPVNDAKAFEALTDFAPVGL